MNQGNLFKDVLRTANIPHEVIIEPSKPVYKHKELMLDPYSKRIRGLESKKHWNYKALEVRRQLEKLTMLVGLSKDVVKDYQFNTESLDMDKFKSLLVRYNSRLETTFNINQEDIEGYVEVMDNILNHTADSIDNVRSNLVGMLNKLESELNGIKVEKYKEIMINIQKDIESKSARIVNVTDNIIKSVIELEDKSVESIQSYVKKMEHSLSLLHNSDVSVKESIGVEAGLTNDQVVNLSQSVVNFLSILSTNKVAIDCLQSTTEDDSTWQDNVSEVLSAFITKMLPGLSTTYKTLLKVLSIEDPIVKTLQPEQIRDKLKKDIYKYIETFAEVLDIDEDKKLFLYHENGYYAIQEDKLVKVNIPSDVKLPTVTNEKLTYITNVLQTTNVTGSLLNQFPSTMVTLLKSKELEANDTNNLYNIVLVLGVIATLANIYRDEVVYGVYGLYKSLSEIGNAYFNLVTSVEKIANGQLKTKE